MVALSIRDLLNDPADFVRRVEAGESITLTRDDRPIANVTAAPVDFPKTGKRPYGLAQGQLIIPDDFDDPLPADILRAFGVS